MIVVMRPTVREDTINFVKSNLEKYGVEVNVSKGGTYCILGLVGDSSKIDSDKILTFEGVEKVLKVQDPFKKANRLFKPDDSIINVNGTLIGGGNLGVMAGPCSVESEEQILEIARAVKNSGANFLRGGAFKPRTSPYSFQGLELEGLKLLEIAKKETGLNIVTEIMSTDYIEEWLMSAEYIMAGGNENVILCERGIRTYENYTRNTLDLSAIPVVKRLSHLPIIVDPSHAAGYWYLVEPLAKAAIAVGADGLMIEVHNNPQCALSDGQQSIKPAAFDELMKKVKVIAEMEGKKLVFL